MSDHITILGLESSCDDTAAAVVRFSGSEGRVLSSVVQGQEALHSAYGGVVPEIAARAHAERIDICTEQALQQAECSLGSLDAIAVTAGPGLIGGLLSGVMFAKGLAEGSGKPLFGINHLAGHALTARLTHGIGFPYLALLVSGGHCQFLVVKSATDYIRLGSTLDDAPGEAFDKCARSIGLPQPGGPAIEKAAAPGDPDRFAFPRPLLNRNGCNMSFSGLKTSFARTRDRLDVVEGAFSRRDIADMSASFQLAVRDILVAKTRVAIEMFRDRTGARPVNFAVAGGVAANQAVRKALQSCCEDHRIAFIAPPLAYCTDNAAMIAWVAIELLLSGHVRPTSVTPRPRWPLDEVSTPLAGSGKKGPKV